MEEVNNFDEEDEDVVIQGSALYEHLSKLGYTDFESISIPKKTSFEKKKKLHIKHSGKFVRSILKWIYIELMSLYYWIIQENRISEKQLNVILKTEVLLNDHYSIVNSFLPKHNSNAEKITLQELVVIGVILASSTCILVCTYKILPILFTLSIICCASYIKYLRFYANKELKNVILLQNNLFIMCKKSHKILQRDYDTKLDLRTCQQFFNFFEEKLRCLQLLMNTLVQFMEDISHIYYQYSQSIVKLLPTSMLSEELFTKFERDAFKINDKINCETLKKLYHIYLLVQSEMLYLLAIAYNSNTWINCCHKMPETKLAHIIHMLAKTLILHKVRLSEAINAYDTCKIEPIPYKTRNRVKWHDPTIQLDLASYKLQLSYSQIFLIFKDMDDCLNRETIIDKETTKTFMERLNKAFKEMDTAKSLAEFVVLLMAKSEFQNLRNNTPITNDTTVEQNSDLPVISDSEPQILDEVFEEYIKEEYQKPLHETADEYTLEQYKLDKLLTKNFMNELKEVLVDKYKSMSERESKALERMYKNITKNLTEENANKDCQHIPIPPPMPSDYIWSKSTNDESNLNNKKIFTCEIKENLANLFNQEKVDINESEEEEKEEKKVDLIKTLRCKNIFNMSNETYKNENEQSITYFPQILLETQATRFTAKLPPAFLQEETFIGNGENSEDEINDASDN